LHATHTGDTSDVTTPPRHDFLYEHCDVPDGVSLADWRASQQPRAPRRAQITGGFLAAVATLAPIVLSVRGSRPR
jgi:hypothetical protein